ncbi:MAG: histidine kinase [Chitinophagaceae bacterium]|nr:histidine kinase [Chitinophagaceae bacterium]
MNRRLPIRLLSLVASLALASVTNGQYLFENLTPRDGLTTREVRAVYQDKQGFMWMGTMNGFNRFDGNQFIAYNHSTPAYPKTLGEIVTAFAEDSNGRLLFGTNNGVGVLHRSTGAITELQVSGARNKKQTIGVKDFAHDSQNRLWVASTRGIFVGNADELRPASELYPFAKELDSVICLHSGFVFDSTRNIFWLASITGLYSLDLKNKKLTSWRNNGDSLPIYNSKRLNSVAVAPDGSLWIGCVDENALWHYDFRTAKLEKTFKVNENPKWILTNGCNNLFFDKQGRLWISTWLFTSFVRLPDGRFENVPYDETLPHSIGYGLVNDAMQDNFGNIWLATINGVSKLPASSYVQNIIKTPTYPFFFTINFANVNVIEPTDNGIWWLGKMEGLVRYDTKTKKFERFAPHKDGDRWNEISDVKIVEREVWCATLGGVQIFNPQTKKFRRLALPGPKDPQQEMNWIFVDKMKVVWLATWQSGVYRYDPASKEIDHFFTQADSTQVFKPKFSYSILQLSDDKLWIGNAAKGIVIYEQKAKAFTFPSQKLLSNETIISMTEGSDNNIWASMSSGIMKFSPSGELLDSITVANGLIRASRYENLCIDAAGRLWTRSRESLFCIQTRTKQVTKVNIDVNFSFNDHWNSLLYRNKLLYGTMLDNVVIIQPEKFQHNAERTPPLISGFRVFEEETPIDPNEEIQLSWKQNFFSIDFSSPFHREDATIQYAYKLEGFNTDWVYCGRRQTAAYTNVPSGSYRFRVKTTDANGDWNTQERVINIRISTAFWNTLAFRLFAGVLGVLLLLWLYRLGQKRKRQLKIDATIDYFANSVYGENSVNEICWDIARNCIAQLQFEDCVVYLLDKKTNRLVQKAAYGPKNPKGHEIINPIEIEIGQGIVGTVAATGKPLMIADTTNDTRYIVDDEPRYSELAIPIMHDNKVIGVIDSEHSRKNFFTDEHLKALNTIASISSNKIAEAQAEELAKENEIKLLEINKMLAESQLMALRAQMNPHFVFNCLNSIQECIVTEKYGEASKYLNKFSKLFRMVLNNSGKNLVTMNEEKQVLELYLELEQMRFEKSFSYEMQVDEDLEADEILIPSMLLQPYVENALWHGLMHKEGERKLYIEFKRLNEDVFRCVIDDNGIGRKKSFELKEKQSKSKRHESKGLKISKDRIDVLQKQGFHATLEMIDKENDNGESTGTTIVVELSTFLKN